MECNGVHLPVLPVEVLELLRPAGGDLIVDCTVGAAGHAEAMLAATGGKGRLIGIDLDEKSLVISKQKLDRFGDRVRLFQGSFSDIRDVLAEASETSADVVLADLGLSSGQLDDPQRGFSFSSDGPLDMRINRSEDKTAADLIYNLTEKQLADLIFQFGQERFSRRIAHAIVEKRKSEPIERTARLAEIVSRAIPAPARRTRRGVHPATRTFMALRIAVNDEMGRLDRLLAVLPEVLSPGGRAGVISFHSLEDRRVKLAFREMKQAGIVKLLTKKPITASQQEIEKNPRSRSAKFRVVERV